MNILLVGGTGFLGTHVCERLCITDDIFVIGSKQHKYRDQIEGVTYLAEDWRTVDYRKLFGERVFHKVLLIGWSGHPRSSNQNIYDHFQSNVVPLMGIIHQIYVYSKSEVHFFSSLGGLPDIEGGYGKQNVSGYAASKLSIEAYLRSYSEIFGRPATVFRISNPFGRYQDFLGSQGIVSVVIYRALTGQKISVFGDSARPKDYIDANTAAELIANEVRSLGAKKFQTKVVASSCELTVLEVLAFINLRLPLTLLVEPWVAKRVEVLSHEIHTQLKQTEDRRYEQMDRSIKNLIFWINSVLKSGRTLE